MGTSLGGGSLYIHPGLMPSWLVCVWQGLGKLCMLLFDLVIKGNSGIQACWEWWFCLIKTGEQNKQTPPFLLSMRPLHGPNHSARALGLRQRYLARVPRVRGGAFGLCWWLL